MTHASPKRVFSWEFLYPTSLTAKLPNPQTSKDATSHKPSLIITRVEILARLFVTQNCPGIKYGGECEKCKKGFVELAETTSFQVNKTEYRHNVF